MPPPHHSLGSALARISSFDDEPLGLLRALLPHRALFRPSSEVLRRGTVLWSLTTLLDHLRDEPALLARLLPTPTIAPALSVALRDEAVTTASLVYRSWVSLVYMRSDEITSTLHGLPHPGEHLSAYVDLLALDEVRHIRNAISHGTFEAEFLLFRWRDRAHTGQLSYDLLRQLDTAVFALWLSLDAVAVAPDNASLGP